MKAKTILGLYAKDLAGEDFFRVHTLTSGVHRRDLHPTILPTATLGHRNQTEFGALPATFSGMELRDVANQANGIQAPHRIATRLRARSRRQHRLASQPPGAGIYEGWKWVPGDEADSLNNSADSVWHPRTPSLELLQEEYLREVMDGAARKDTKKLEFLIAQWSANLAAGMGVAWTSVHLLGASPPDGLWAWLGPYYVAVAVGLHLTSGWLQRRWYSESGMPVIHRCSPAIIEPPKRAPLVPQPIATTGFHLQPRAKTLRFDARRGLWLPHRLTLRP